MPDSFITTQRFEDHVTDFKELSENVKSINKELGTKVSWVVFWAIVLLLVGIVGAIFGVLYNSIKEVQNTGTITQNTVYYIKGVLDNAEITK